MPLRRLAMKKKEKRRISTSLLIAVVILGIAVAVLAIIFPWLID
jgi:hypothetical protein